MSNIYLNDFSEDAPGSIYWKNTEGIYLSANNYLKKITAKSAKSIGPVIGGTDYLAFPKSCADQIRDTDIKVMEKNCPIVKQEGLLITGTKEIMTVSSKKPFYDEKGEVAGVLGMTIYFSLPYQKAAENIPTSSKSRLRTGLQLSGKWRDISLTRRQAECAFYLSRGKTIKEISAILVISPRTVEDYIKQLKIKFSCYKKSALIEVILSGMEADLVNYIF